MVKSMCGGRHTSKETASQVFLPRECRLLILARMRAQSYGSLEKAIFIALFCIPSSLSESDTVRPVCHTWQAYFNSERTSETYILTIKLIL